MSLLAALAEEGHHDLAPMIMDPIWFAVIAAAFFIVIGLVTYSFRDVAHRSHRKSTNVGPGAGTHG
ncbi:hypothetical protein OH146_02530 [Salinibacterium sp. SYSU T00001]|uniref:hypothetical protein n=1 Tax=Homoserinimonas sedimenticola TaxID=2986805 RepID=UPI00223688F8|nr:hypothetical protein [Salinibacterium sedimenticola]MCW4384645.1 hypothetical protein [Salinibacterium sedimenticola]